jgi:release factor glutamine methyltransferase
LPDGNRILDIGTGSGCIALALKSQLPKVQISACDISAEALEVSWENGCNNQLEVNFFQADILSWKLRDWPVYDLIVSNPPYVTESEKKLMHRNVLDFEPAGALFIDDNDPLLFYRTISEFSLQYLNSGGSLFFEINENFGTEMIKMLEKYGFTGIQLINDLQGKNRMIAALKS